MKTLSLLTAVLAFGLTLAVGDAEAKRLGSGKSSGMQRESVTADRPASPAMAPAPARAPAAAPPAAPKRSWMGPLAGLAAGLGLAALASHFGFGEELASMLLIGLLVMAVMVVVGLIMRRRAAAQAGPGDLRYAGAGADHIGSRRSFDEVALPASSTAPAAPFAAPVAAAAHSGTIPSDFDTAAFERNAKVNFIRLQAANDAGNLDDIREFTTPEMFAEISMAFKERASATQETDVVSIEATVLDVAEEAARYIVSVRFNGLIREQANAAAEPFDEIWHMVKPREGRGGWTLAGIQQIQ
ncbi:MAG: Tim44-like domain-containing protein [Accumulibacter sp.]|jgi:predicted lipid-binding transport protein (Tim44 family)|uniref:Tim44 domain-containing protein n=1 Tax=Accumulibacter sp. TaxID=2053492 RepID=UPI002FC2CBF4